MSLTDEDTITKASRLRIKELMLEVNSLREENIHLNRVLKETLALMKEYREMLIGCVVK